MELNYREFLYGTCKGRVSSYVARAKESPERIVKSIHTLVSGGSIGQEDLDRMLSEVMAETVRPFLSHPWNQPERDTRFRAIKEALLRPEISSKAPITD